MSQFSDFEEYKDDNFMNQGEKQLMISLNCNDVSKVKEILSLSIENNEYINIFIAKDSKSYTALHLATLNHHLDIIKLSIEYAKKKATQNKINEYEFTKKMETWVNSKSYEGFTALHLAAFRGDLPIIEELVLNGAKIDEVNDQGNKIVITLEISAFKQKGLNCLHIAAQGDQPISLVYFKMNGLDINGKDYKGSTPLHWASYIGCENAINFLINWNVNINEIDQEGQLTPLHLAVISGNTRVVRKLLIKGSDKTMRDKQGKTPADLAKENGFHNILKMLEQRPGCAEKCNIVPVFKPMKKKKRSLIIFCCLFVLVNTLIILFTFSSIENYVWIIIYSILNFLSFSSFIISWQRNPGYITKSTSKNLLDLLKKHDCSSICPECELVKVARSKHCEICGRCVAVYDHHCPWINNCVGARNHGYFLCFILSVWINMLFLLIMILYHIYIIHPNGKYFSYLINLEDKDFYPIKLAMNIINSIIMLLFLFPLGVLVYVQLFNFILNKTTPERYGFKSNDKRIERTISVIIHKNSNETNPSFIELSNSESKKSLKIRRNLACKDYINNCHIMCCLNAKEKTHFLNDESKDSLVNG